MDITSNTSTIQYLPLTSKYLDAACDVIKNALFIPGKLNETLGIPNDPEALAELEQLSRLTAKDGVSVIALDRKTDEVAGAAFNKIWIKSQPVLENFAKTLKNTKSRHILEMIIKTENMCDIFEILGVDCVMEIFLLGTSDKYKRQGIGQKLCEFSVDVAQKLFEPTPKAVTAIFNSPISQKIGRHLGLTIVAERSNAQIEVSGKVLEIPEETTTTLEYKKLQHKY